MLDKLMVLRYGNPHIGESKVLCKWVLLFPALGCIAKVIIILTRPSPPYLSVSGSGGVKVLAWCSDAWGPGTMGTTLHRLAHPIDHAAWIQGIRTRCQSVHVIAFNLAAFQP